MNKCQLEVCPLCKSTNLKKYKSYEWSEGGQVYFLKNCIDCGSTFTSPMPSDRFLKKFYENVFNFSWYQDHLLAKLVDSWLRYGEYKNILGKKVLDYGGGLGYFSRICRLRGHESVTYDPYTTNQTLKEDKWDSVVALHSAEHSNNPDGFIRDVSGLLKSGGVLIIAVPNYDGLGYREHDMDWVWSQPPFLHTLHISAKGLSILLERAGFENLSISFHDRWDANIYADTLHKDKYRKLDGLWGRPSVNKNKILRKSIAGFNTINRYLSLLLSKRINIGRSDFAELQIIAYKK